MFGLNCDDIWEIESAFPAIQALPKRATVRVVVDNGVDLEDYNKPVHKLAQIADVMIQVNDSYDEKSLSLPEYVNKAQELMGMFKDVNCLWEVGNEINGDWLSGQVWDKVLNCLQLADSRGLSDKTVITFFNDDSLWPFVESRTFPKFQYALLSCYPSNMQELRTMVREIDERDKLGRLQRLTGASFVGIGEYGEDEWSGPKSSRVIVKLINEFEKYPNGGFYWNFQKKAGRKDRAPWKAIYDAWTMRKE